MILSVIFVGFLAILFFSILVACLTFWLLVIFGGGALFMCALVVRGFMEGSDSGDYRARVAGVIGLVIVGFVAKAIADHLRKEEIRKAEEAARKAQEEALRKASLRALNPMMR